MKSGRDKIIGNVYRPNTAPLANLDKAIEIHNQINDYPDILISWDLEILTHICD